MTNPITTLRRTAVLTALAVALVPGPAQASRSQTSIVEDDAQLVFAGDAARGRALDDFATLGADEVHSIVNWARIAPAPTSRTMPAGFDGANPAAYPASAWDPWDDLVRGATARGIDVLLSPASPIPAWASGCHGSGVVAKTCRPNPTQYKSFVQALGTRSSGR